MGCNVTTTSIKLEAVNLAWGKEQCRSYLVNDGGGDLDGLYFNLDLVQDDFTVVEGYVYMDTGASVDPAPAGRTLIAAASVDNLDSDEVNAAAIKAALDGAALAEFMETELEGATLHIENKVFGAIGANEGAGDSTFTYNAAVEGFGGSLGKVAQGGVTLNMETQTSELKADQTGELLLGEINLGNTTSIEASFIELTKERLKLLIGKVVGDVVDLGAGEEFIGIGTSRLFQEMSALGGRLVLHPTRISDITDRSEDWSFHLTAPMPNSLNFSGTEQQGLEVTFKPYVDESKDAKASVGGLGDWLKL